MDGDVAFVFQGDKIFELLGGFHVSVARKNEAVAGKVPRGRFQFAFFEIVLQKFSRENLGRFHVRLVEGVYSHDASGEGDGELEPEKLGADFMRVVKRYLREGNPSVANARGGALESLVSFLAEKREHPVFRGPRGVEVPLVEHRQDSGSVLAGALGHQLFGPAAERKKPLGKNEAELVPALPGERSEKRPQSYARVFAVLSFLGVSYAQKLATRGLENLFYVDSGKRRGHEAEVGKYAEPPADVRVVKKHLAEAVLAGRLLKPGTRVGDADEVFPRILFFPQKLAVEVLHQGNGFHRGAGLRGNDEKRFRDVLFLSRLQYEIGVGRVEKTESKRAFGSLEHACEHFAGEARAAHPEDQNVGEPLFSYGFGKFLDFVHGPEHPLRGVYPPEPV